MNKFYIFGQSSPGNFKRSLSSWKCHLKANQLITATTLFFDCAVVCCTQCTWPPSHLPSAPSPPRWYPQSLTPSFGWSTLYQPVCACQHVTPGWCPSLSPLGPFWLRSALCLPNHLGAGYGDELLTTAGQPMPHNPRPSPLSPDLLLTHLHGDGAGICFLSCVRCQPAPRCPPAPAPPPPPLFILSPPLSVQSKGSWMESCGREVLGVCPTERRGAVTGALLCSAGKGRP